KGDVCLVASGVGRSNATGAYYGRGLACGAAARWLVSTTRLPVSSRVAVDLMGFAVVPREHVLAPVARDVAPDRVDVTSTGRPIGAVHRARRRTWRLPPPCAVPPRRSVRNRRVERHSSPDTVDLDEQLERPT